MQNKHEKLEASTDASDINAPLLTHRTQLAEAISPPSPISSLLWAAWPHTKSALLYLAAAVTSCPNSVYAFSFMLNTPPEAFSMALWESLPLTTKSVAIVFTLIYLGMTTLLFRNFIPIIVQKTYETIKDYFDGILECLKDSFFLLMAAITAIATIALGYNGFIWAGPVIAWIVTTLNFLISFGFSIVPLATLIANVRLAFNEDWHFQKALVSELKRIKPSHIPTFENTLKTHLGQATQLDETCIKHSLFALFNKTHYIDLEAGISETQLTLFNTPDLKDTLRHYAKHAFNFSLGAVIGSCYFIFVAQTGFDGSKLLCQVLSNTCAMDNWPYIAKLCLATLTGFSAGIFGLIAGSTLLNTVLASYDYMKTSLLNGIKIILIYLGSGIAGIGLAGASQTLTFRPNLFNILAKSPAAYWLIGGNWLLAVAFNLNTIINTLSNTTITYNQTVRWLESNPLSKETVSALRQHSHFKAYRPCHEEDSELKDLLRSNALRWKQI